MKLLKNAPRKASPANTFFGIFVLVAGMVCVGWWISDHVVNQEYYSVLGQKESVIKNNYEKLRMVSRQNAQGLPLELKKEIKDEIDRREWGELQYAKASVDKQFGR